MSDKLHYFLKLNPPRTSFAMDMTEQEYQVMQDHVAYWTPYLADGTIIVLGPVVDPKGIYGIAIAQVDSEEQINELISHDPANGMSSYEVYPMKAVTKQNGKVAL